MTNEELQIIISAQIQDLQKKLDKANQEVSNFEKKGSASFAKFTKAVGAVGKATAVAMKATATAIVAGATALVGLAEGTKEYRVAQAKLNTAFETAGASAEQAKTTYNQLYRVLGDSDVAVEAANHLAKLTTNEKHLAEYTKIAQGVYAQFGDSLAIEGLTEAINHTAKLGEVQGTLADALEWSGVSVDEFNEQLFWCNTESEREALIRNTLNGLYAESAENYEKNAAGILAANEAQALLTESLAELGAVAEPIVTIFKQGLAGALQTITPHISTLAQGLQDIIQGVDGGAETMSKGIEGIVSSVLSTVVDLLPTILTIGVDIITALLDGLINAFPKIITTLTDLLPQIVTTIFNLIPQITGALLNSLPLLLEALFQVVVGIINGLAETLPVVLAQIVAILPQIINAVIDAIPLLLDAAIQLLMALVQAVPEIIPPLIEALPQIIDNLITTLLESIPVLLDAAIELLMTLVEAVPEILPPLVEAIPLIIENLINTLLNNIPLILNATVKLLFAIVDAIPKIIPPLVSAIPTIITKIVSTLISNLPKIIEGAVKLFMGIVTAIPQILPKLIGALGSLIGSALSSIGGLFKDVGTVIGDALGGTVKKAINGVLSGAIGIINGFISAINFAIDVINLIPGVSISKISKLEVPKLARGGVIDSATLAVVGEQGKEAVVPLENNLEWLDKLASMLTERMGGAGNANTPIVLTVDKKVLAETSIRGINDITRQTGTLPLILV